MNIKAIIAVIIAFVLAVSSPTVANAITDYNPTWKVSNGTVTVGASSDGTLAYTRDNTNWTTVDVGMSKNGITSLTYTPSKNLFVASSFFSVATSSDGVSWSKTFLPVGEKFNPADIITDAEFFGPTSMSINDIQSFIDSKIAYCVFGYTCLNSYSEQAWSRDATVLCSAYNSEGVESAARILWKVSQACGVKAEVLLVTLQKENSLVTNVAPSTSRYRTAMGYGCPDTAACDSEYFGFYNQVYNAAKQFKRYTNPAGTSLYFTWYPVGREVAVRWSPNADCGASPVTIANKATAGLYYYTPYQPNSAALKNIQGLGDDCSAYGNRNFWRTYNQWFNTDKDYKTFVASNGATFLAVDDDGGSAFSSDAVNWGKNDDITVQGGNKINSLVWEPSINKYYATTTSPNVFLYSADGVNWTATSTPTDTTVPNPVTPPAAVNVRTVVDGPANRRTLPSRAGTPATPLLQVGETVRISGWITGENVDGINIWYKLDGQNLYSWAGVFNSQSTDGVTNLNEPAPAPTPIATPTPTVTPTPSVTPVPTVTPAPSVTPTPTATPTPSATPTPTVTRAPAPAPQPVLKNIYHTVAAKETITALASKYKTTTVNITAWNNLPTLWTPLFVGQKVVVNKTVELSSAPVAKKYHTVTAGQTLSAIASMYKISINNLVALNSLSSLTNPKIGQQIRYQ